MSAPAPAPAPSPAPAPAPGSPSPELAPGPAPSSRAHWTDSDVSKLLSVIKEHAPQGGDGMNFTGAIWRQIAKPVDAVRTVGGPKGWSSCKSKWSSVSAIVIFFQTWLIF